MYSFKLLNVVIIITIISETNSLNNRSFSSFHIITQIRDTLLSSDEPLNCSRDHSSAVCMFANDDDEMNECVDGIASSLNLLQYTTFVII